MGEDQEQADLVDATRARELTEQLRTAIEDVRAAVLVPARRVRDRLNVPAAELETGPAPDGFTAKAWRRHASAGRDLVAQNHAAQHRIGVLALETVPAYGSERQAEDVLARVANDIGIGIGTEEIPACRRDAVSGDVRAMDGWWRRQRR
jgi:hypothetical protein